MGNRAVIAFGPNKPETVGIYLHWNGGPESVAAFMQAAKQLGVRDPLEDDFGIARIVQIIGNFFGGTTSIGINALAKLDTDNGDNGVYVVKPGFVISPVRKKSFDMKEYEQILATVIERNAPLFARNA